MNRMLETGLLILAVALGIGAASAGMSLLVNILQSSREMLASPAYQEIVVSTVGEADEMDDPVSLKPVSEDALLTSADLDAADMAPSVDYAYVKNHIRMHFINEESIAEEEERRQEFEQMRSEAGGALGSSEGGEAPPEEGPRMEQTSLEDLENMALDGDIVIAELEEINGYEVTPGFFDAWELTASSGSLFTESDMTGTSSIVVLGAEAAELLAPEGEPPESLPGKKLLTRDGLVTVIGIAGRTGGDNDDAFFQPYQSDGGGSGFRRMFMNTQLRFTVDDPENLDETALLLQKWFDREYGEQQIVISNPRSEAVQLVSRNTGIGLLILFLSLAGLFIASVNVSNILMSRAMRMKKHVGILMALGASRRRVMELFGTEALGIILAGAVFGTFLSIPLRNYMQSSLDISRGSGIYTLLGISLSAVLTFFFGILPARQYSGIDPAKAMRAA